MDNPKTDLRDIGSIAATFGATSARPAKGAEDYDRFALLDDALGGYAEGLDALHQDAPAAAKPAEQPKVKVVETRGMGWGNSAL